MSLLRDIDRSVLSQVNRHNKYANVHWVTPAEAAQLLEEMLGCMQEPQPTVNPDGSLYRIPRPTSVDGATIYTSAGPVTIRVGLPQ